MADFLCFCYGKRGNLSGFYTNCMVESGEYIKRTTGASLRTKIVRSLQNFEPCHEIMVFFVLHKLILQTRMGNHPVGLDV